MYEWGVELRPSWLEGLWLMTFASSLLCCNHVVCFISRRLERGNGGRLGQEAVPLWRPPRGMLQRRQALRFWDIYVVCDMCDLPSPIRLQEIDSSLVKYEELSYVFVLLLQ